ncbi:MAG: S41 family peptidase [Chloroflexota bacterium]
MKKQREDRYNLARSILWGMTFGISLSLSFALGFLTRELVGISAFASPLSDHGQGYPLLDEVQSLVDTVYLRDQPGFEDRQYGAIRGMLQTLDDRYTFFVDPPVAQSESDVLAGTYGGIGVQIQRSEDGQLIMFPFENSPALEAGIEDGDILIAVDSEPVNFEVRQDVLDQMLRGEVRRNNGVELTYRRDDSEETIFVLFGVIEVPSVVFRTLADAPDIGYLQIIRFTNRTPDEVEAALETLSDVDGLIVDMRDNNGGLLQESVDVAGLFLDGGVVLYERNIDTEETFEADDGSLLGEMPVVVLVNGGTASAAELVAGAIQDRDRGILIGQQTFGKGTVQQIFRLSDESSIHITSAEWFTPDRNQISGVGLEPDIAMIPDANGRDVELGEAVRYLNEQIAETNGDTTDS